jgi:hypothetical protein
MAVSCRWSFYYIHHMAASFLPILPRRLALPGAATVSIMLARWGLK